MYFLFAKLHYTDIAHLNIFLLPTFIFVQDERIPYQLYNIVMSANQTMTNYHRKLHMKEFILISATFTKLFWIILTIFFWHLKHLNDQIIPVDVCTMHTAMRVFPSVDTDYILLNTEEI